MKEGREGGRDEGRKGIKYMKNYEGSKYNF